MYGLLQEARLKCENQTPEALERCEQALRIARAHSYEPGIAWYLRETGSCYHSLSRYDEALLQLNRACRMFERLGIPAGLASATNIIGIIETERGNFARGLECFERYVELSNELGRRESAAIGLGNIAEAHLELGEPWRALQPLLRGLHELRELDDNPYAVAWVLSTLGRTYHQLGQTAQAVACLEESLKGQRALGDRRFEARTLVALAENLRRLGQQGEAQTALRRSLELSRSACDRLNLARAGAELARLLLHLHGRPEAIEQARSSLSLALELGDPQAEVRARLCLGVAGQDEEGLEATLRIALAHDLKPLVREVYEALSEVYAAKARPAEALAHLRALRQLEGRLLEEENRRRLLGLAAQFEADQAKARAAELEKLNAALQQADRENARLLAELRAQSRMLELQALQDPLTGLWNRRYLDLELPRELERAQRYGHPLSVALADLDHFKGVNDRFSHAVGDAVLREVARIFQERCRAVDIVARYGGEEFVLILPETGAQDAWGLLEAIREAVRTHDWGGIHPGLEITLSVGLAGLTDSLEHLMSQADTALYAAKQTGRNQVVLAH